MRIEDIEPKKVFRNFKDISMIPRGSGNEKGISDFLMEFASRNGLEAYQDEALNVIIKKSASPGYEDSPVVILQGHMDMVCEKREDVEHDFENDPLELKIEGDYISADGTTLGADNGIALAYAMAVLESDDMQHPPLEVLFTTEEETGMGGASRLDASKLQGKILVNIDSEEEGELLASCAGGVRAKAFLPVKREDAGEDVEFYKISLSGLSGGHSGMEIDKKRANAIKLLGRVAYDMSKSLNARLCFIEGGAKMNAIPRSASCIIAAESGLEADIFKAVENWEGIFKREYSEADPGVSVSVRRQEKDMDPLGKESSRKAMSMIMLMPNGIQTMSQSIEGLVESSTNMGVVSCAEKGISFESAVRSSVKTLKYSITNSMECLCTELGGQLTLESDYPEWEYKKDSYIREVFERTYEEMNGKKPVVTAIHAGLECGIFKEVIGDIDMISFGPNLYDVHTPQEHMSISSVKRTWDYLVEVLKRIK